VHKGSKIKIAPRTGLIVAGIAQAAATPAPVIVSDVSKLGTGLFCPIEDWMFWILLVVAIIMILWAAYIYVTAGDDTEKVHKGTRTITYAAIAIIVALLAKGFPLLVGSLYGQGSMTSPLACP
jgi:hypothetical protein